MPRKKRTSESRRKPRTKSPLTITLADSVPVEETLVEEPRADTGSGTAEILQLSIEDVLPDVAPVSAAEVSVTVQAPVVDTPAAISPVVMPVAGEEVNAASTQASLGYGDAIHDTILKVGAPPEEPTHPVFTYSPQIAVSPHPPTHFPTPPTPHVPEPHPPTPHAPTPHVPTPHVPTPHAPTPHRPPPHPPTPHSPTPTPTSGATGTTGDADFTALPVTVRYPEHPAAGLPVITPESPPVVPAPVTVTSVGQAGGNTVAIVGVVGLAALMGMVAATGLVAIVALNDEK